MGTSKMFSLNVRKDLLGPAEKAHIVTTMRGYPHPLSSRAWARIFHRLPATIIKIAEANGLTLRHD